MSRVGDELLQRADAAEGDASDEEIERDAFESAQEKGWDKSVKDG